jgi:hypothetical protein
MKGTEYGMVKGNKYKRAAVVLLALCLIFPPLLPVWADSSPAAAPALEGYTPYFQNESFSLAANAADGSFVIEDKAGNKWYSTPPKWEEDTLAQGSGKLALASLIQITYSDPLGNVSPQNGKTASVDKGGLQILPLKNGVKFLFHFPREGFTIPLELTLETDGFSLSVLMDGIVEDSEDYRLISVTPAPYFSAAEAQTESYLLTPDGSGALIVPNAGRTAAEDYRAYVYGRDAAVEHELSEEEGRPVRLPVFGLKRDDLGFLAVITEGAPRTALSATAAGKRSAYSGICAEFFYRDSGMVLVEKKNQTVRVFEKNTASERHSVRYFLLSGGNADYMGMAKAYRNYLTNTAGLKKRAVADYAPLVLEIPGGVMAPAQFWGFPVNRVAALTTYSQAGEMLERLKDGGVDDFVVDYVYWGKGANTAALPTRLSAESALGGASALKKFAEQCKSLNAALFLNINTNLMVKSRFGYNKKSASSVLLQRGPAARYPYDLVKGTPDRASPEFLLTPSKLPALATKQQKSAAKLNIAGLSTHTLGSLLYSDFGSRNVTRNAAETLVCEALSILAEKDGALVQGGNAYALPAAAFVTDVPGESSGLLLQTVSVPFYQLALHGLVPLTTENINEMGNPQLGLLWALETGSLLKFRLLWQNEQKLPETKLFNMTGTVFGAWEETVLCDYSQAADFLRRVSDKQIISHSRPRQNVSVTVFEGGLSVIVNRQNNPVTVEGVTLSALSYYFAEGVDENGHKNENT